MVVCQSIFFSLFIPVQHLFLCTSIFICAFLYKHVCIMMFIRRDMAVDGLVCSCFSLFEGLAIGCARVYLHVRLCVCVWVGVLVSVCVCVCAGDV